MLGKLLVVCVALGLTSTITAALDTKTARADLSATEVANRNVVARGGLEAWRGVQSISESGKLGAGGNKRDPMPTVLPARGKGAGKQQIPASPRLAQEALHY